MYLAGYLLLGELDWTGGLHWTGLGLAQTLA